MQQFLLPKTLTKVIEVVMTIQAQSNQAGDSSTFVFDISRNLINIAYADLNALTKYANVDRLFDSCQVSNGSTKRHAGY